MEEFLLTFLAGNCNIPWARRFESTEMESNLQQRDLIKCKRMDGRHLAVPVRDAVCFSLCLIELLIYPMEPLQISGSCTRVIHKLPNMIYNASIQLREDFINRCSMGMFHDIR